MPSTTINYSTYYNGLTWPSDSVRDRLGHPKDIEITAMAPQYAASALAKLIRNALEHPVGALQAMDIDSREEYVRKTRLGLALAAKALGLNDSADIYALYSDITDLPEERAGIRDVLGDVLSILVETNPLANYADLGRVAAAVVGDLIGTYTFRRKNTCTPPTTPS